MKIEVKNTNFGTFAKALQGVPTDVNRQFAIGLSRIAKAGAQAAREAFDENYIERNQFMRRSIISTGATKDRLTASVGTVNRLMALHLFGGRKTGNVAVRGIRGDDKRGKVSKKTTVAALQQKADTAGKSHQFFERKVNGRSYIFQKTGGTHARMRKRNGYTGAVFSRTPIVPMWLLRDGRAIKVKADWNLPEAVQRVFATDGPKIISAIIEDAWNHAREKGRI